jgi:hypothetical protein
MRYEIVSPILLAGLPHATIAEFRSLFFRLNGAELEPFNPIAQGPVTAATCSRKTSAISFAKASSNSAIGSLTPLSCR